MTLERQAGHFGRFPTVTESIRQASFLLYAGRRILLFRRAYSHICPVDFEVIWLQSNNDAGLDLIRDSGDLESQAGLAPYR